MYCVNCGLKLVGRFCGSCGTPATPVGTFLERPATADSIETIPEAQLAGDWRHEVRYAVLLKFPEVRDRLANVQEPSKSMTGDEWMELYDKAFKPLTGVSVQTIAKIAAPIYAKMGIKTGKTRKGAFADPPGQIIVDVLCALARNGLPLSKVHQGQSGCVIEAKMPSDLWSFEGQIVVTVEAHGSRTTVEAATKIPGQLYDWGKSNRCLEKLFGELHAKAA